MNELMDGLTSRFGLDDDKGDVAAEIVLHGLKQRLPAIASQLNRVLSDSGEDCKEKISVSTRGAPDHFTPWTPPQP